MSRSSSVPHAIRLLIFLMILASCSSGAVPPAERVSIPDPRLRAAIETALGTSEPSPADMLRLTELKAEDAGIADLSGLEYAGNLKIVQLGRNAITDMSVLTGLPSLEWVDLSDNRIEHIPELTWNRLRCCLVCNNPLSDLAALPERFQSQGLWVVVYEGNRHPDLTPPPLAIADGENGTVELPGPVRDVIGETTLAVFQRTFYETLAPKRFADLFGPVSCRRTPLGEHLFLYLYTLQETSQFSRTVLVAFDDETGRASAKPLSLSDRHLWVLRQEPRIFFEDVDRDGRPELVTRQPDHRGTEADYIFTTYWRLDETLFFAPVLSIRTYAPGCHMASDGARNRHYSVVTSAEALGPGRVRVVTGLAPDDGPRIPEKIIGTVTFAMDSASSTFQATEASLVLEEHAGLLWRENLLEYEYRCSSPTCEYRTVQRQYPFALTQCPRCGEPILCAGARDRPLHMKYASATGRK